ncbi:unnamed protein product [Zymoseptoria tritici ST99CH_1E4]|uniref:Uncharacterized protein n=1 Tax=Zymoseptoria tritici ST99CH_1E4 TaxID=1276532 RepID=A0A2H1GYV9_ZYMTR|nr:unnamed protein product [Zymoseptoria tritici ST99CH_1E4]
MENSPPKAKVFLHSLLPDHVLLSRYGSNKTAAIITEQSTKAMPSTSSCTSGPEDYTPAQRAILGGDEVEELSHDTSYRSSALHEGEPEPSLGNNISNNSGRWHGSPPRKLGYKIPQRRSALTPDESSNKEEAKARFLTTVMHAVEDYVQQEYPGSIKDLVKEVMDPYAADFDQKVGQARELIDKLVVLHGRIVTMVEDQKKQLIASSKQPAAGTEDLTELKKHVGVMKKQVNGIEEAVDLGFIAIEKDSELHSKASTKLECRLVALENSDGGHNSAGHDSSVGTLMASYAGVVEKTIKLEDTVIALDATVATLKQEIVEQQDTFANIKRTLAEQQAIIDGLVNHARDQQTIIDGHTATLKDHQPVIDRTRKALHIPARGST